MRSWSTGWSPNEPGEHEHPADIVGQLVADAVDLGAGLDTLRPHVLVPVELQEDLCVVFGRRRGHAFHAGQGRKRFLDGARNQPLDLLGRRSLVRDLDEDPGKLDVRKLLERQQAGCDQPDQGERDEDDHGRDRPPQCDLRMLHDRLCVAARPTVANRLLRSRSE